MGSCLGSQVDAEEDGDLTQEDLDRLENDQMGIYKETKHDKAHTHEGIDVKTLKREYHENLTRNHSGEAVRDFYQWESKDVLGTGISGDVVKVTNIKSKRMRAMKTIRLNRMDPDKIKELRGEIDIMKTLDHPNIVKLYEVFEERNCLYLIMELCTGGELFDRLFAQSEDKLTGTTHFTEKRASTLVRKMLAAVNYLHVRGICHRDLKLENFIFANCSDDSEIILIDFGLSKLYHGGRMREVLGTSYYVAPEVLNGCYGMACDIWSLGVITYMLLCGLAPFSGSDDMEILEKVSMGKFVFEEKHWANISTEARDFVSSCLILNPERRMTSEEALKHPWIVSQCHTEHKLDKAVIENLEKYTHYSKFKRAALFAVAFVLGQEEINKIREAFEEIDTEANGFLTFKEFHDVLAENGVSEDSIKEMYSKLDHENIGHVDYTEFIAAALEKRLYLEEEALHDAFEEFDVDRTGIITHENLHDVMGKDFSDEEITEMIAEADFEHNGHITYEEFKMMMAGVVVQPQGYDKVKRSAGRSRSKSVSMILGSPDMIPTISDAEVAKIPKRQRSRTTVPQRAHTAQ